MVDLSTDIRPRKWQLKALEKWKRNLRGIAHVVTGGGKTIFAQMCMIEFFEKYPEGQCVIVVPTITLLDQWYITLMTDIGIEEMNISCYGGGSKSKEPSLINLYVINTARSSSEYVKTFENKDTFLIVDECHRSGSFENAKALKVEVEATLGLSATPQREFDDGFRTYLEPYLGEIIFEYGYAEAHKDGVIVDFQLINVKFELMPEESLEYKNIADEIYRANKEKITNKKKLTKLIQKKSKLLSKSVLRISWAVKLCEKHEGKRIIIFHESIDSAEKIYEALMNLGASVSIYHSKMSSPLRIDNLKMYRKGIVDILITCRTLDEGANIPETNVAIIAHSTSSERQRIQRLGRALRHANNKKFAIIYTLYASNDEEEQLRDEEQGLLGVSEVKWVKGKYKV